MIYIKEENPSESIGTPSLKVPWLEPKIFQIKKMFELRFSLPVGSDQEWEILVGTNFWMGITLVLINISLKMKYI